MCANLQAHHPVQLSAASHALRRNLREGFTVGFRIGLRRDLQ
jgi:hypothetical protein